ncbi:MAG: DNA-directed RNA polymerase subunit alpha [Armatimonadetes bacterium]|nr:DNA-directed RNA polymerase subunit alpha [Armatimonadota bacterium]
MSEYTGPRVETLEQNENYGRFAVEPLERGYGATLANPLRRVLLSSLRGAAVTSVRIEGVLHEFATIPNLREDTTELLLNLKELAIRLLDDGDEPKTLRIEKRGEGEVTGADVECPADVEVVNPEVHLATLADDNAALTMEMVVERGKGYVLPEKHERFKGQIGVIPLGSAFSPVRKVEFHIEPTRVGSRSDYERLILEITTNGTISPGDALSEAARIVDGYVRLFFDVSSERVVRQVDEAALPVARASGMGAPDIRIEELDFSVRTYNCLKKANYQTVADLCRASEDELMNIRNFGRKSLVEVQEKLAQFGYFLVGSPAGVRGGEKDEE